MNNLKYSLNRRLVLNAVFFLSFPVKLFSNNFLKNEKKIKIIFGSCSNQNNNMDHWRYIASHNPNYIFLLGDNVYGDFFDEKAQELKAAYKKLNQNVYFKYLRENVTIFPIWDDHDYGKNDGGKSWIYKKISKNIFLNFFNVPHTDIRRSRKGIYKSYKIKLSDKVIKVISLDTRYFKDDFKYNTNISIKKKYVSNKDPKKTILGKDQWNWFLKEIKSDFDLLIIQSSYQVLSEAHGWEKWGNFPSERKKLLDNLSLLSKPILIVSGDRHFGGIYKSYDKNIIEVTASSFNQKVFKYNEEDKLRTSRLIGQNNFGVIEINKKGIRVKLLYGTKTNNVVFAKTNLNFA